MLTILQSIIPILQFIFLIVLLIAAVFIVVAVVFQRTGEDGLSSTIAGGSETYYGKDKSVHTDKLLHKGTMIAGIVFAVSTLIVYVIQPDYAESIDIDAWKDISNSFNYIFGN